MVRETPCTEASPAVYCTGLVMIRYALDTRIKLVSVLGLLLASVNLLIRQDFLLSPLGSLDNGPTTTTLLRVSSLQPSIQHRTALGIVIAFSGYPPDFSCRTS